MIFRSARFSRSEIRKAGGTALDKLYVIVGLGNPGNKYENTRHNVGFRAIDAISKKYGIKVDRVKYKAIVGEGEIGGEKVLLVKPQTFMNLSGESVREIVQWYKLPVENIIVIYDDVDIAVGTVRIRPSGSSGTHNGMKSVIYQLQADRFPRIRIGIGKAPDGWDLADYVLGNFTNEEAADIDEAVTRAANAVETLISAGVEAAMNLYNGERRR